MPLPSDAGSIRHSLKLRGVQVTELIAHRKQYVIGPAPVSVRPSWIAAQISEDLFLSHCPKLRVTQLCSRDGRQFFLLGLAVPADQSTGVTPATIAARHASEIENWTCFWAGRWLLISKDRCWQDASGSLAAHYRTVDGRVWISSSTVLLSDFIPGAPPAVRIPWRVRHAVGMDWVPLPFTTRGGIYKLLPQRSIDPRTGATERVRFAPPAGTDPARDLASALTTILSNWARCEFSERLVGLTAGLDTRTVFAAACAAGIDFQAF